MLLWGRHFPLFLPQLDSSSLHEYQPLFGLGGLEQTSLGWNGTADCDFFADSLGVEKEDASEMLRSLFYKKPDSDNSLRSC